MCGLACVLCVKCFRLGVALMEGVVCRCDERLEWVCDMVVCARFGCEDEGVGMM